MRVVLESGELFKWAKQYIPFGEVLCYDFSMDGWCAVLEYPIFTILEKQTESNITGRIKYSSFITYNNSI